MVEPHCVFCRIIGGEEMVSLVHEDDRTIAFLDIQPMSQGHTLIATKDHYETLFDMPEDLAAHCLAVARRIAPGIQRSMGAHAINIFSANGKAGGQDVPHFSCRCLTRRFLRAQNWMSRRRASAAGSRKSIRPPSPPDGSFSGESHPHTLHGCDATRHTTRLNT
jgi:histidine triad (HIT) family protein